MGRMAILMMILVETKTERRKGGMTVRVYFRTPARDDCRVLQASGCGAASDSFRLSKTRFHEIYLGF